MAAPADVLDAELALARLVEPAGPLEGEPLSPELILVAPPELAELARSLLPDPEPFDQWLRRLRASEPELEPPEKGVTEWEYVTPPSGSRGFGAALFATACVVNAALPVVLFLIVR